MSEYILAIDQGTTSSRTILFDEQGRACNMAQQEFTQHYPQEGWAEHDPIEILRSVLDTAEVSLKAADAAARNIKAVGITNQRETTVAWDRTTGVPLYNALVWLDVRTSETVRKLCSEHEKGQDRFRETTGLPVSTYFSAVKMRWMIDNVPAVKEAVESKKCMFGTIDSWLVWNLTGGVNGGIHVTDVSNASRYMLMNIHTLKWDQGVCNAIGIPMDCLPGIVSNSEIVGECSAVMSLVPSVQQAMLKGVKITSMMGDQHAALLGHGCLEVGSCKNTYGTGCFMLMNTGHQPVPSRHGLLTTMGFLLGGMDAKPIYALEGSVACAGRSVQWLRDHLGFMSEASEIENLAKKVTNSGGVTLVPAFSGLFAPYWREDARAVMSGMTLASTKEHICRAVLDSVAMQTVEVCDAMEKDAGTKIHSMYADGGMTKNNFLMQIQADTLGADVLPARMAEATAFGAAFAAGLAVNFYKDVGSIHGLVENQGGHTKVSPCISSSARQAIRERWSATVDRCMNLSSFTEPLQLAREEEK